ncbi:hypothetical protein ACO0LD_03260 [Undibacterium sp. Ji83W]|uniref:hypothetical protein n=1 Tax=Undibacterium sp. Ji83W TaxID=3413043 RepID=UPI003BF02EA6
MNVLELMQRLRRCPANAKVMIVLHSEWGSNKMEQIKDVVRPTKTKPVGNAVPTVEITVGEEE